MSIDPKKIDIEQRRTVSAKRLRTRGERITIDFGGRLGLAYLLDGRMYHSPGISERGEEVDYEKVEAVVHDGGKAYDLKY